MQPGRRRCSQCAEECEQHVHPTGVTQRFWRQLPGSASDLVIRSFLPTTSGASPIGPNVLRRVGFLRETYQAKIILEVLQLL